MKKKKKIIQPIKGTFSSILTCIACGSGARKLKPRKPKKKSS
ncbi:MAG TPA: hypothetical protein VGI03_07860 [Verrucomicrobiae bacterium]|jgi:hypothetical protein